MILLDILPISTTGVDESGRVQIEPDPVSMGERGDAGRDVAEHLVSWLNETGTAPSAIAHAIRSGSARLEMLMRQYDSIEHAKEVLADLQR